MKRKHTRHTTRAPRATPRHLGARCPAPASSASTVEGPLLTPPRSSSGRPRGSVRRGRRAARRRRHHCCRRPRTRVPGRMRLGLGGGWGGQCAMDLGEPASGQQCAGSGHLGCALSFGMYVPLRYLFIETRAAEGLRSIESIPNWISNPSGRCQTLFEKQKMPSKCKKAVRLCCACCRLAWPVTACWAGVGLACADDGIAKKPRLGSPAGRGIAGTDYTAVRGSGRITVLQFGRFRAFWRARDVGGA